jgi:regulation of enolase protein 1 (concanavalin A-like superfamily)
MYLQKVLFHLLTILMLSGTALANPTLPTSGYPMNHLINCIDTDDTDFCNEMSPCDEGDTDVASSCSIVITGIRTDILDCYESGGDNYFGFGITYEVSGGSGTIIINPGTPVSNLEFAQPGNGTALTFTFEFPATAPGTIGQIVISDPNNGCVSEPFYYVLPICPDPCPAAGSIFINELHYENTGADANEFVEVAVANGAGVNLSTTTVTLYNGADGLSYASATLDEFTVGNNDGTYTYYTMMASGFGISDIRNDLAGIALDCNGTFSVIDFLSYEGTFTAADGPAIGMTSTDMGVAEDANTAEGSSLELFNGNWIAVCQNSKGDENTGAAIPVVSFNLGGEIVCIQGPVETFGGATPTGGVYSGNAVTDDGNGTTFSFNPAVGDGNVTYTYTDGNGCTAVATSQIQIQTFPPPILTVPASVCISDGVQNITCIGNCSDFVSLSGNGVTLNSNGFTYDFDPVAAGVGSHTLEVTASDGFICAEKSYYQIEVYGLPTLTCPESITVNTDPGQCSAAVTVPAPTVTDGCSGNTVTNDFNGTADASGTYNEGTTMVTFTVTDGEGNTTDCNFNITVNDMESPIPNCLTSTVNLGPSEAYTLTEADVLNGGTDNCGTVNFDNANPPVVDCEDVGTTLNIVVSVNDGNGNTASCTATVTVADPNSYCCAPAAAVCNNITIQLDGQGMASISVAEVAGSSTAECGLQSESLSDENFDCADLGNISVTYTITDVNDDSDNCTATVTVQDNLAPQAVCQSTTVSLGENGTYALQESDVYDAVSSTDNCEITDVSFPATTYDCEDTGQTFSIPVSIEDASGNTDNCMAMITVQAGSSLPGNWNASDIGAAPLGNEYSFDPCSAQVPSNGEYTITGSGNNATSSTTDNVAFAYQEICGDGTITAKVESVSPNGYGGLMIRESSAAGAKQVALFSNQSNNLRHEVRYTTNGPKQASNFFKPASLWLRLQRQGNWIFAYYSTNGTNFSYVHAVMVPMQSCVQIGLASFTYLPNAQTEAVFSNVSVVGSGGTMGEEGTGVEVGHTARLGSRKAEGGRYVPTLFPNPASSMINLEFEEVLKGNTTVLLRNQLGQVLQQRQLRPGDEYSKWDVSELSDGVYFFEIQRDGQLPEVLRLVKAQ